MENPPWLAKGGQNSRKYMTKEKATELARKAAYARHGKKRTPKQK